MKKILCLSGGGVRGIAQLQVLKKLEEECGRPLHEEYDLVMGSSVGAINASIIASGCISMADLADRYDNMIKDVFKRNRKPTPKYVRTNFLNEWAKIIPNDLKMGDVKTKLITTTVDLVTDQNVFYKSWHEDDAQETLCYLVTRSFAAPLYFGQINDPQKKMVYSDGGVGTANLPLDEAKIQAEAFGWYSDGEEVEIHAVGTLYDDAKQSYNKVSKFRWFRQVLEYMNPSEGGLARSQSRMDQIRKMKFICGHIPAIKFKYWDMGVNKKYVKMDKVKYLDKYTKWGTEMAKEPVCKYNY